MNPTTTIQYTPSGYECYYSPKTNSCEVTVKGYTSPDGKFVERGGPAHPEDKRIASFSLKAVAELPVPIYPCTQSVRETFEDALLDKRDLLGAPMFRNTPQDANEKRMFANAFDAAQKIRTNTNILGVNKLIVSLSPSFFAVVDCFARDKSGKFWLIFCTDDAFPVLPVRGMPLAAYILEAGKYIPTNATVRLGVWQLAHNPPKFIEVPYDRITTRDFVINHLLKTPF
jgi:hypothetical protein